VAFGRSLSEQVGTLTAASLIYLLGGVIGCSYQAVSGRLAAIRSLSPRYLLGCGSLFVLYIACISTALGLAQTRSQVLEVGLMNYLWPMLTVLFSVPILGFKASPALVPGALMAAAGVFLATTQGQPLSWSSFHGNLAQNSLPYMLGATAAISWALYSTLSRRWANKAPGGAVYLFMLSTGLILGTARLLVPETTQQIESSRWTWRAVAELSYMVIGSNLAYAFWERAMRRGDIVLVAVSSYFTPLLSTMVSILYLGARAGWQLWFGCALVIAGAATCKLAVQEPEADVQELA
jgi:drug/metabolite transporter (DMT)-like permease